jgi:hypothetical protein
MGCRWLVGAPRAQIRMMTLNEACYKRWVTMRLDGEIRMNL